MRLESKDINRKSLRVETSSTSRVYVFLLVNFSVKLDNLLTYSEFDYMLFSSLNSSS